MRGVFLAVCLLLSISISPQAPPNPVPIISWLTPPSIPPAGSAFTLAVYGAGFVSGSTVLWNGLSLATTFVSASELTAEVPPTDTAANGTASVTVFNPTPGGGVSNTTFFSVTLPTKTVVLGGTNYIVGENPDCGATGDFNGDGKLDLAIGNLSSATVSILLGNGDGTFGAKNDFVTGTDPRSIAVGDFNGDGKLDLVVANNVSGTVSILLGNGDGTFAPKMDFPVGVRPRSVVVGDFNGDGKLDLAVANHDSNTVSILLGNGDGTFAPKMDFHAGVTPFWITTADFNGDGKLDLAVANLGTNSISVLLGNGDGTFGPLRSVDVGPQPMSVATGDFNGDGKADLAVTNEAVNTENQTVSILLGNGDGTFAPQMTFSTDSIALSIGAADFNGDGKTDLAVLNGGIMLGNGDGTFQPPSTMFTGTGRKIFVTAGDFNGDGRLDIVDANIDHNMIVVYLQIPRAFVEPHSLSFGSQTVGTTSKPRKVTLTNTGSATLQVNNISTTGDFAQTNTCSSTLTPEMGCTIEVTFHPKASGTLTGTLTIPDNASGSPQIVSLTGTGE